MGVDLQSHKPVHHFIAILLLLGVAGCYLPTSGHMPIVVSAKTITLAWDPPQFQFSSPPLSISSYRIYYARHGTQSWSIIGRIPATGNPSIVLNYFDFGNGEYDFAVGAVDLRGVESALHTSLDASADPFGGWYVIWNNSN
jgi:hypothetical protein